MGAFTWRQIWRRGPAPRILFSKSRKFVILEDQVFLNFLDYATINITHVVILDLILYSLGFLCQNILVPRLLVQISFQFPIFSHCLFMVVGLALSRVSFWNVTTKGWANFEPDWAELTLVWQVCSLLRGVVLHHLLLSLDPFCVMFFLRILLDYPRIHFDGHEGWYALAVLASAPLGILLANLLPLLYDLGDRFASEVPFLLICYFAWDNGPPIVFKVHELKPFSLFAPCKVFWLLL